MCPSLSEIFVSKKKLFTLCCVSQSIVRLCALLIGAESDSAECQRVRAVLCIVDLDEIFFLCLTPYGVNQDTVLVIVESLIFKRNSFFRNYLTFFPKIDNITLDPDPNSMYLVTQQVLLKNEHFLKICKSLFRPPKWAKLGLTPVKGKINSSVL